MKDRRVSQAIRGKARLLDRILPTVPLTITPKTGMRSVPVAR